MVHVRHPDVKKTLRADELVGRHFVEQVAGRRWGGGGGKKKFEGGIDWL